MTNTMLRKLLIGLAILPLLIFIAFAVMVMVGESRTETARREIVKAGGKSTTERQVPPMLLPLLGPQGHSPMDRTVIVELLLNDPRIGDPELERMSGYTGVRLVDLSDSRVTDAGLGALQRMKKMETLFLNHTQVTQPDKLLPLTALRYLRLDFSAVPESNLACLSQFPELRRVSLAGLKITEAGTKLLSGCQKLESLNLNAANLGEHGLSPLQGVKNLQYLSLKDAKYNPVDMQALQKALPGCKMDL